MRMPGICHQLLKVAAADVNQAGMITALKIYVRLTGQAVVEDHFQPIGSRERRHCAWLAIMEDSFDLLFVGHIHLRPNLLAQLSELDVARRRQDREHEPIAALEHDRLGQAAEHDMTSLSLQRPTTSYLTPRAPRYCARVIAMPMALS